MRIILLGPPGSGKGTQGDLIEKKYGFPKVSSGDLLRQAVKNEALLDEEVEGALNCGRLVSDDIIMLMIKDRISQEDCRKGYVMDGFPRNLNQAKMFEEINGKRKEIVLDIYLSEKTLIERLGARRICPQCGAIYNMKLQYPEKEETCDACGARLIRRQDDELHVIKERLRVYRNQEKTLIDYYKQKGVYNKIDGEKNIEDVFSDICEIMDKAIA